MLSCQIYFLDCNYFSITSKLTSKFILFLFYIKIKCTKIKIIRTKKFKHTSRKYFNDFLRDT